MSKATTICLLGAGVYISMLYPDKKVPLIIGIGAASSLLYTGSLFEFDRLITDQPLSKASYGYWMIKGGILGLGMMTGSLASMIARRKAAIAPRK